MPFLLPGNADDVAQPGFVRHLEPGLDPVFDDQGHDFFETIDFRHDARLRGNED
ncbi:hypothetical protein D3C81_2240880 [compost metagenome]